MIIYAISALMDFCGKYGCRLYHIDAAEFAIAWLTGESFVWLTSAEAFDQIVTVQPTALNRYWCATVRKTNRVNEYLTAELNRMIRARTNNRWPEIP